MRFNDPSGHCATLSSGGADLDGDGECWQLAYQIYGLSSRESFAADWQISGERWLQEIATQGFADAGYLQPFAERYQTEWAREMGLPVDKVVWHPVVNPPVRAPGQGLVETVVDDAIICRSDWRECGQALDDASVALSSIAVGCGVTGLAPCAAAASVAGTTVDVVGMSLAVYDLATGGETSLTDATVAGTMTLIGGSRIGAKPRGTNLVGWGASIFQWVWDHFGGE